jgi:hypothetical protein
MPPSTIAQLIHTLWPEDGGGLMHTSAPLDPARDAAVAMLVALSYRQRYALFGTGLEAEFAATSPTLMLIQGNDGLTRDILRAGWGRGGGFFLHSRAKGTAFCRSVAGLVRVRAEDGRRVVLRFWDPQIWRSFLATCDGAQRAEIFSSVESLFVEAADPAVCLQFRPARQGFARDRVLECETGDFDAWHRVPA